MGYVIQSIIITIKNTIQFVVTIHIDNHKHTLIARAILCHHLLQNALSFILASLCHRSINPIKGVNKISANIINPTLSIIIYLLYLYFMYLVQKVPKVN